MTQNNFPKLALGTWLMGGTKEPDPQNDDKKDIAVIQLALENGVSLVDTAQNYARGRCEEIVGQALKELPRESFQILTKQFRERLSYENVLEDCQASMDRLGVDYLDYFLCHAPNPDFKSEDFFKATNTLIEQGQIKNVGVSNFGPRMLEVATKTSKAPIMVNQINFSLNNDDIFTSGTYDFCVEHNITMQCYRTLVGLDEDKKQFALLAEIGKSHNASPHQIALAYINSYKNIAFTLRASSIEHWNQIKEALTIKISQSEIDEIRLTHKNKAGMFQHFLSM